MRGAVPLVLALFALGFVSPTTAAEKRSAEEQTRVPAVAGPQVTLSSNGTASALAARETAGPDTFAIYGGADEPTEGKFQLANGVTPDWGGGNGLPGGYGGGPDAWATVDLTDQSVYWHQSQFNAQTLGTTQPSPNHAMWSGLEASSSLAEGWVAAPGYGNNWNDGLIYESPSLADPSVGQTVGLDFYFHHDTEPGYDFFIVEYDSAGTWTEVLSVDGYDSPDWGTVVPPGALFSELQLRPIQFQGNDYGGDANDQIRIRLKVTSDGAWSNQDGLWPSIGGAAQVDQVTLTTSQGSFTEDFETAGPYLFLPDKSPFAGDFADVYARMTDIDPCRDNVTPIAGFLDQDQMVRNGPGPDGTSSTGGSTSPGVNYGIPGNYVSNFTGGLSFGLVDVYNEIWSPEILWDLPTPDDDDIAVAGAYIRWDGWVDLPLTNGHFFVWHVRSALPGEPFDNWTDRNFVYYGVNFWTNQFFEVTDLLQPEPERVQMALGLLDYASVFGFAGTAATPSPCFDNAAFIKYRLQGPAITTRNIDLAQDGFPANGSVDVSTPESRGALDIPFSMARDVNSGDLNNVPGDSIVFNANARVAGTEVTDIRMVWALKTNALFEDALRAAPSRIKDENVTAGPAGSIWTGEVVADSAATGFYYTLSGGFEVSLPDLDFMYPGDVLHYYIQATDNDGRVSTLPFDTSGFLDFSASTTYDRTFTVRGLPTITDNTGAQPEVLVWNDFGHRGGEQEWLTAFQWAGYEEGVDYDTYTTMGPSSLVGNGLGSAGAHGATADQITGYEHLFYFAGNLTTGLLSNGNGWGGNDKSNDIDLLEQWHALPGTRNAVYFGDYIASGLVDASAEGLAYLQNTMNVAYGDRDVGDVIGGQTAPMVMPHDGGSFSESFSQWFVAYGGCLLINEFDQIQPGTGAEAGHLFTDTNGLPIVPNPDPALGGVASVINQTASGLDITFPMSSRYIYHPQTRTVGASARAGLFQEILRLIGAPPVAVPIVSAPKAQWAALSVAPNPFNPVTTVKFTAAPGARGSVKVFNLRGELVTTLHTGEFQTQEFRWEGTDSRGAPVSSGVYLIRATDGRVTQTQKVALVK